MHKKTTIMNGEELFGDFLKVPESQNSEESFERYWHWPSEIGNGFMYTIKLRPGLMLGMGDFQLWKNLAVSFEVKFSLFVMGFSVPANVWSTPGNGQGKKDALLLNSGQSFICYLPEWQGIAEYPVRTPVRSVSIYVDPLLLNTFMEGQHDRIPTGMRGIVNGADDKLYYQASTMTHSVNAVIHQMLNCTYQFPLKRLYLEGKALELISYSMAQFVSPGATLQKASVLRPDDIERVQKARNVLIRNLRNPPSVLELSRMVGINDFKLREGFHRLFGTTVFGYLRDQRFKEARFLLEQGRVSVSEAAFAVGYSDIKHFYNSFKKHFGTTPGAYRRKM